ncbi:serine/threonine-protein kinase [Kitasatospora sp. NPDC048540]|uniref:serine/threonine-protein kinase n=1 Tax=unclassified Kitasatospora TaxID=2633591 RepID=UPI000539E475|nr:serine/threonine-protein kinase [Kitasatospora sp. MBT63]
MTTGEPAAQLIDGRFELLQRLGGGGMGLVWRARDTLLQREVALKEVRPPDPAMLAADPAAAYELRERVLREAQALARLQHPHVVIIYHIVDTAELPHPWLVMELVSGGSLQDRLAQGPLSAPEAARIGRGVLSALRAAHAAGIQHRDVKPGNVLLRTDGTPVLTDFGIAALSESTSLTATGSLIGSPEFIAPERIRGQEGNPSSDLWSLGMMLYVAVEGHHPLRRSTSLATLAAVLDEPLPPPVRSGPLGPTLAALLARDPAARPDAEQLDRLLAAAEQGIDGTAGGQSVFAPTQLNGTAPYQPTQLNGTTPYPTGPTGPMTGHPAAGYGSGSHPTGGFGPAGYGTGPTQAPWAQPGPASKGRRNALIVAAVAGVALVGLLGWSLNTGLLGPGHSGTSGDTTGSGTHPSVTTSTGAPATASGTTGAPKAASPAAAAPGGKSLLTPDGARAVTEAIRAQLGTTKVVDLTIYDDYASAEVVNKSNPKVYDDVTYRNGKLTSEPGSSIGSDQIADLSQINWDQIPTVFKTAEADLKVSSPTMRYIKVDYGWFASEITLRYYLLGAYEAVGYLTAGAQGKVIHEWPNDA